MKIGLIHKSFQSLGGSEKTTLSLIQALKKTDHYSTLYTLKAPSIEETRNFKIQEFKKKKIPFLPSFRTKKLFREAEKEDVLVFIGGGFSLYRTKASNVILYCHSTFKKELQYAYKEFRGLKKTFKKKQQKELQKTFSYLQDNKIKLISNSKFTQKEIKNSFRRDSIVIYPPVNIKTMSKFYHLPKTKKVITLTRFSPMKNLDNAIQIATGAGLKHEFIGIAKKKAEINLYSELEKKSRGKDISLYSNLPQNRIDLLLSSAKVYFQPSVETFGIAVVEAISAGCIPIVPNNSAHFETVPFRSLRFEDKDEAIKKLQLAVSGEFDYLRPELRKHIEKFSIQIFQERMLNEIEGSI